MQKPNDTNRQRFADVWDAIEDTPEEAARMRELSKSKMEADALASQSDEDGNPTTEVTLWLDVDVVDKFKASGDGWQTRINEVLRVWHTQDNWPQATDQPHSAQRLTNATVPRQPKGRADGGA